MDACVVEQLGGPLQLRQPGGAIRSTLEQYRAFTKHQATGGKRSTAATKHQATSAIG
jgi:hypothetical protein